MPWRHILVAVGANLPDAAGRPALATCEWAVQQMAGLPGLSLQALSRWYETDPIPAADQPPFVNGVALLSGTADPEALLASLHGIEGEAGRIRTVANAARTLDLDLIAMDGLVMHGTLQLPHPRLAERAFVLVPLCDVAPGWRHPLLGQPARELLPAVQGQAIRPLPGGIRQIT